MTLFKRSDLFQGTLSLVLMLDQFSRNIYRDSPIPFVLADPQARIVARHAFENGYEDKLHPVHRAWLYMVRSFRLRLCD